MLLLLAAAWGGIVHFRNQQRTDRFIRHMQTALEQDGNTRLAEIEPGTWDTVCVQSPWNEATLWSGPAQMIRAHRALAQSWLARWWEGLIPVGLVGEDEWAVGFYDSLRQQTHIHYIPNDRLPPPYKHIESCFDGQTNVFVQSAHFTDAATPQFYQIDSANIWGAVVDNGETNDDHMPVLGGPFAGNAGGKSGGR